MLNINDNFLLIIPLSVFLGECHKYKFSVSFNRRSDVKLKLIISENLLSDERSNNWHHDYCAHYFLRQNERSETTRLYHLPQMTNPHIETHDISLHPVRG